MTPRIAPRAASRPAALAPGALAAALMLSLLADAAAAQTRLPPRPAPARTLLPMTLDQPMVCPAGQARSEIPVAAEASIPAGTLTRARFDGALIPSGALLAGRVTWRIRPMSPPGVTAGRFNILVFAELTATPPGYSNAAQVHNIGSLPPDPGHTSVITGPWNAVAYPAAVQIAANMLPATVAQFNASRAALATAGLPLPLHIESQVGSLVQTSYAILETCHAAPAPGAVSGTVQ
jgi:hypothetical protein